MAKKEKPLLICYCRSKKKLPRAVREGELFSGKSCFCLPYNAKVGKGTNYRDVIIS